MIGRSLNTSRIDNNQYSIGLCLDYALTINKSFMIDEYKRVVYPSPRTPRGVLTEIQGLLQSLCRRWNGYCVCKQYLGWPDLPSIRF